MCILYLFERQDFTMTILSIENMTKAYGERKLLMKSLFLCRMGRKWGLSVSTVPENLRS